MGDRAGNFAVQNADVILAIGTRISIRQVGYNWTTWARAAKVIMVDIDENEMRKHTLHVDVAICSDAKFFINEFLDKIDKETFPCKLQDRVLRKDSRRYARLRTYDSSCLCDNQRKSTQEKELFLRGLSFCIHLLQGLLRRCFGRSRKGGRRKCLTLCYSY